MQFLLIPKQAVIIMASQFERKIAMTTKTMRVPQSAVEAVYCSPVEADEYEDDPFYSPENIELLKKRAARLEAGGGSFREPIEVGEYAEAMG